MKKRGTANGEREKTHTIFGSFTKENPQPGLAKGFCL